MSVAPHVRARAIDAVRLAAAVAATALVAGCGTEEVCPAGPRATYDLTALSSTSDLATAQQLAPAATKQIATRAAERCATVRTGITTDGTVSNLQITAVEATPPEGSAAKRGPLIAKYERALTDGLKAFTTQLHRTKATPGSPVYATIRRAIEEHADASTGTPGPLVIAQITDGLAVERTDRGRRIDLQAAAVDPAALREMTTTLARTVESARVDVSVLIVGFGANSRLGDARLNRARTILTKTLNDAGIAVRFSRSAVPADPARQEDSSTAGGTADQAGGAARSAGSGS